MNKRIVSFDMKLLAYIHIALAISVPVTLMIVTSCIEKPKLTSADLGAQVAYEKVQSAVDDALMTANPYSVRSGQAARFLWQVKVETEPAQSLQSNEMHVQSVCNDPIFRISYQERQEDLQGDGDPVIKSEVMEFPPTTCDGACTPPLPGACSSSEIGATEIETPALSTSLLKLSSVNPLGEGQTPIRSFTMVPFADREYTRETYHDLKVTVVTKAAPEGVQARKDCGGLTNCQMQVTIIEFNVALWYSDVDFDKVSSKIEISTDVPFLSTIVSDCATQQQIIGERDYMVRTCKVLTDFIP